MSNFDFEAIAGVSFDQIFGSDGENTSFERVEAFLDKVVAVASEQAQQTPNQLVRVVSNGKVTWMTQEQALDFIKINDTQQMKKDIERALRGELKVIRQELEILIAIAMYTLDHYKTNETLDEKEIQALEPSINRRRRELNDGVSETAASETLLAEKRKRAPVLQEYETNMADFLSSKARGDMQRAAELAKWLEMNKKKYVLLSRSIEPDVRTIYYHRLNLQKTKKRIINTQNELCTSRQDALKVELQTIQTQLNEVHQATVSSESDGMENAVGDLKELSRTDSTIDMGEAQKMLLEKTNELTALENESKVLEKQSNEVQGVINVIAEDVLKEPGLKDDVSNALKATAKPKIETTKATAPPPKKTSGGMHVGKARR